MPKYEKEPEPETDAVSICAGIVAFIGVVTIILGIWAQHSENLMLVDNLVRYNSGAETDGMMPTFTTLRIYGILMGFGVAVIIGAIVGIIGVRGRKKPAISCYLIFTVIIGFLMLMATFQLFQRVNTVQPIINTQVKTLCDRTIYDRQTQNLGCFGNTSGVPPPACGGDCTQRLANLKVYKGCDWLPKMCDEWEYKSSNVAGVCDFVAGMSYKATLTQKDCQKQCDAFNWCTGFVAINENVGDCIMNSSHVPQPSAGVTWTPNAAVAGLASNLQYQCYTKTRPLVLPRFNSYGRKGAWVTLLLAIALIVSMACTCYNLYNVNFNRQGKLSCKGLCLTIFCPCAAPPADDHLGNLVEDGAE